MEEIAAGTATPAQIGAFVTALRMKGETAEELAGLTRTMRQRLVPVPVEGDVVDTAGTGGHLYPAGRHRLYVRAAVPPRPTPRRGPAPRDRHPHGVQPAWPAAEPRRCAPSAPGRRGTGASGHHGRGTATHRLAPRAGGVRRGRPGRDLAQRA